MALKHHAIFLNFLLVELVAIRSNPLFTLLFTEFLTKQNLIKNSVPHVIALLITITNLTNGGTTWNFKILSR